MRLFHLGRLVSIVSLVQLALPVSAATGSFGVLSESQAAEVRPTIAAAWREAAASGNADDDQTCGAGLPVKSHSLTVWDVLSALRRVYVGPKENGVILDVGAGAGHGTAEVLAVFGRLEQKKYSKEYDVSESSCTKGLEPSVSIFCVEVHRPNLERLQDRAKRSAWLLEEVKFMQAAASNATGKVQLWASARTVDMQATLTPRDGFTPLTEKAVSVDLLLKKSVPLQKAFVLLLSVNGHEHRALVGSQKSLKKQLVRFVIFEGGSGLADSVALLWKLRYACFALLGNLVPLSGDFWDPDTVVDSLRFQVFCARKDDAGLKLVLRTMYPDSPNYLS